MKPLAILLIAAALATVAGVLGSTYRDHFQVAGVASGGMGPAPGTDVRVETATIRKPAMKNTVLVDAIIGASVCLALAAAAGWIARGRTIVGAVVGLIGGALAGAGGGFLGSYINDHDRFPEGIAVARAPIVHGTLWILIAVVLTVAVMLATRRRIALSLFGRLALFALIAAAVYPVIASLAFPLLNSDKPLPEGLGNTAVWIALPTALFAFAIAQANRQPQAATVDPTPATAAG
jgi:hypothetical protein